MDNFYNIKRKPLPQPDSRFALKTIGEQVYYGGLRVVFPGGGHILIGDCGKDDDGNKMMGIIVNDGTHDTEFIGVQQDGF